MTRHSDSSLIKQLHCFKISNILDHTVLISLLALIYSNNPYTLSLNLYIFIINIRFKTTAAAVLSQIFKNFKDFKKSKFKVKTRLKINMKIFKILKIFKIIKIIIITFI